MSPDNKIKEFRKEVFGEIIRLRVCMVILMDCHEVEPIFFLLARAEKFDVAISKCPEQSFISDIAKTIESKLRLTLL
jgi:hypothetical protein